MFLRFACLVSFFCSVAAFAEEQAADDETNRTHASGVAPDLRDDDTNLKLQKGDFVIVPVPIVTPTVGSGLIVGGAYFYRQTEAQEKVQRRRQRFHGTHPFPTLTDRSVIIVDDGIAAGSTIRAGILALQKAQAGKIIIAIPTGHDSSLYPIAMLVDAIYCANLRGDYSFAVANAYQNWTDVSEDEVATILEQIKKENKAG